MLWLRTLSYHILGWMAFILYEVTFVTVILGSKSDSSILLGYILPYLINIGLFYCHADISLKPLSNITVKRLALASILIVLELMVYCLIMSLIGSLADTGFIRIANGTLDVDRMKFFKQLWRGIYFISFSTAFWFARKAYITEKKILQLENLTLANEAEKTKLERNMAELENAYLQTQINPHLLFNTLNFLYSTMRSKSPDNSDAVLVLSDIMRFSLRKQEQDKKIPLQEEVDQIRNIVKLNQYRFNHKLHVTVEVAGDHQQVRIIPLLLLPFVENIFKYGDLLDLECPARITVSVTANQLLFETFNKVRKSSFPSHGIGLANVRKRLETYYVGRFQLDLKETGDKYLVTLMIKFR